MDNQNDRLVIRQYPFMLWIFGLALLCGSAYLYLQTPAWWYYAAVGIGVFLLIVLFSSVLTVTADRNTRTLTLMHSGLVVHTRREIPVGDITMIQVESSRSQHYSGTRRSSNTTYRIVVITKDNETIPFTTSYDSARASKEVKAKQLREFLGVGGADVSSLGGKLKMVTGMAQQAFQKQQEALTGPEAEEHITSGVHWKVQSGAFGGVAVTRWFSPDFRCPSGFVYLAQKVQGQGSGGSGLLGGLNKMLYHQSMGMYGFSGDDTPEVENAGLMASVDAGLDQYFGVFTSDQAAARQILSPGAIAALVDWGRRYPLARVQKAGLFGQLVVMFSPRGTYAACMGTLIPEAVEEIANLGVALVKAK
jgi:hypothetical protein